MPSKVHTEDLAQAHITEVALRILKQHGRAEYGATWWAWQYVTSAMIDSTEKAFWKMVYERICELEWVRTGPRLKGRRRKINAGNTN